MSTIEEMLLTQNSNDYKKLFELIPEIPRQEDKMRFATIAFLCGCPRDQLEQALGQLPFFDAIEQFKTTAAGRSLLGKVVGVLRQNITVEDKCGVVEITRHLLDENIEGWVLTNPATGQVIKQEAVGDVYVFVCGPGNYIEYTGVMDYANKKKSENVEITYGCTCMLRQDELMNEILHLSD